MTKMGFTIDKWSDPTSGCSMRDEPVSAGPAGKRRPRPGSKVGRNMMYVITVAAVLMSAGMVYMNFYEDDRPTVTLSSDGQSIGSIKVTEGGFVDIDWLEDTQYMLTSPEAGLNFAGWYTDPSYQDAFYRYTPIRTDTTIYAGWNELSFNAVQNNSTSAKTNQLEYTFTNTTAAQNGTYTTWTINDSFKTSGTIPGTSPGEGVSHTATLNMGMYDVTMTMYSGGEKKSTVRSIVVGEGADSAVTKTVNWNFGSERYTLTYSLHVSEYIEFAKMNRNREFKIPQIADHTVWDVPVIHRIVDDLNKIMPADLSKQDQMNFIMMFMDGYWQSDSVYHRIPGVHRTAESVEYYKYPVETLYDWAVYDFQGDCEDMAMLAAALARAYGFTDVAIMILTNPGEREGHAIAGIKDSSFVPIESGDLTSQTYFYELDGYYACDTIRGQKVGELGIKYKPAEWNKRLFAVT
jgi:hypothetical protein